MRALSTVLPILLMLILSSVTRAENATTAQSVGTVTHLAGVLSVRRADGSTKILATQSVIEQGDTLITERDSYARIKFVDDAEVVLRPVSQLEVTSYVYDLEKPERNIVALNLIGGGIRAVTGLIGKHNHDAVSFKVPTGEIHVLGTHFGALFCQSDCGGIPTPNGQTPTNGLHVDVTQGAIVVNNNVGSAVFRAGQFGYVPNLNTPPMIVPPAQAVQVMMPPSISRNISSPQTIGAAKVNACIVQ